MDICRVCLQDSDDLIDLKKDHVESQLIRHKLNEFTINANTEHLLPNYICERCATNLDVAFKFKRKFEDSILKIIGDVHLPAVVDSSDTNRLINQSHTLDDIPNQSNTHHENNEQSKVEYVLIEDTKDNVPQPFQLKISAVYECCPWSTQPSSEESGDVESLNANRLANEIHASDDILNQSNAHVNNELSEAPHGNKVQSDSTTNNNDYNENCPQMDIENEPEDQIHPMESVANDIQTPVHIESLNALNEISNQVKVASDYNVSRDENQLSSEEKRSEHGDEVRLTENSPRRSNRNERKVNPTKNILTSRSNRNQLPANLPTDRLVKIKDNRPVNLLTYSNLQISSSTNRETPLHQDLRAIKKKFRSIIVSSVKDIENFDSKLTKKIINRIYINHFRKNKPYRCDVCRRWFKTKGHVKTHRMLHIEAEYELQCGMCQLRFLTKSHFKIHKCNDKVKLNL